MKRSNARGPPGLSWASCFVCCISLDGKQIGDFRKALKTACKKTGLNGSIVYDLRQIGVRDLVKAGVVERVAMSLSGHKKTRSVFDRYNIDRVYSITIIEIGRQKA